MCESFNVTFQIDNHGISRGKKLRQFEFFDTLL